MLARQHFIPDFSIFANGLAPNRRQAIIWTNADPIHWRIYAALGVELTQSKPI